MVCPYGKTADGFEMQIGVNHLGKCQRSFSRKWILWHLLSTGGWFFQPERFDNSNFKNFNFKKNSFNVSETVFFFAKWSKLETWRHSEVHQDGWASRRLSEQSLREQRDGDRPQRETPHAGVCRWGQKNGLTCTLEALSSDSGVASAVRRTPQPSHALPFSLAPPFTALPASTVSPNFFYF